MKGYRTLAVNGAIVTGTALLSWAGGVDWGQYVSPTTAFFLMGAINIGLRVITTTPVGRR
jgi:hypothetical protein